MQAIGLHYMTGNKETVQIPNRLGHCGWYDTALDTETVQAQKSWILMNNDGTSVLPLELKSDEETVLNVFWADNFRKNIDKEKEERKKVAINMTIIMVFQESSIGAVHV